MALQYVVASIDPHEAVVNEKAVSWIDSWQIAITTDVPQRAPRQALRTKSLSHFETELLPSKNAKFDTQASNF